MVHRKHGVLQCVVSLKIHHLDAQGTRLEVTVAQHAAHEQRTREQARRPAATWTHERQTPDTAVAAASRPLTADLAREAFG